MNKILIIEDDINLRNNVCELLELEGYEVENADNGRLGLEKIQDFFPDLIISDIMMPEMNGYDLLEELMKRPETAAIPLIFLTAKVEWENLRKGMRLGADDYIFKPFKITDLLEAVETRLKKRVVFNQKVRDIQEQITLKVPHELRTPLLPIIGYADLIEELDDIRQIKDMVKVIKISGNILHNRIEKFLIYKDLLIKEYKNQEHELKGMSNINNDCIEDLIQSLPVELKAHERVKTDIENESLLLNEFYLGIILTELLENALKYSDVDKGVNVQGLRVSEGYKIIITDKGRGMDQTEVKSLTAFKKFGENQLAENGLGLGLSIVTKIIELTGYSFKIKSEVNMFTACELIIPAA